LGRVAIQDGRETARGNAIVDARKKKVFSKAIPINCREGDGKPGCSGDRQRWGSLIVGRKAKSGTLNRRVRSFGVFVYEEKSRIYRAPI